MKKMQEQSTMVYHKKDVSKLKLREETERIYKKGYRNQEIDETIFQKPLEPEEDPRVQQRQEVINLEKLANLLRQLRAEEKEKILALQFVVEIDTSDINNAFMEINESTSC